MTDRMDPRFIATPADFTRGLVVLRDSSGLSIRDLAVLLKKNSPAAPSVSTLGGWFSGSHLPTPKLVRFLPELLAACGEDDPAEVAQWLAALERVRKMPGPRPGGLPSPFRGLAAYGQEDAEFFCGRDRLVAELVALVARHHEAGGPVAVVGPSGSGKSSLLRAGLIPALGRGDTPLAGVWQHLLITPGGDPLRELAWHLASLAGDTVNVVADRLVADPQAAVTLLTSAISGQPDGAGAGGRVLLVVDQFEDLFTAEVPDSDKSVFVQALCAVAGSDLGGPAGAVVLGLRADFYEQVLLVPQLVPVLQDAQLVVGPMTEAELRQAITEPPRRAHFGVEDGLVALLVQELAPARDDPVGAAHEPGALPLLSHALRATWEHAKGRSLTVEQYLAAGGLQGAVAQTAEAAFAELTLRQQDIARRLFVRLVRIGDDVADTRRKVPRADVLASQAGSGDEDAGRVLDEFVAARLITADESAVEITHEALLKAWPRLRGWLSTDRGWLDLHRRISAAAKDWDTAGRDDSALYRGGTLQVAREQLADPSRARDLNALERDFIDASLTYEMTQQRIERRRVRRRYLVGALVVVLVVTAASIVNYARQVQAISQRDQALSRQVAGEADQFRGRDVPLSMQLALAAYQISPTTQARSSLLNSTAVPAATPLPGETAGPATEVAVTHAGSVIAVGTDLGLVQLWKMTPAGRATPLGRPLRCPAGSVFSLAFSQNGHLLAAAGDADHGVYVWDTSDPSRPVGLGIPPGARGASVSVALSPDGTTLAAALNQRVAVWHIGGLAHPKLIAVLSGPSAAVTSVVFTPDGHMLAAGSKDSKVYLWNVASPASPRWVLTGPASQVFSLAVSPDGHYLAAGTGAQHDIYLWKISDPGRRPPLAGPPLTGPSDWVNSVAFSPDGRTLAAGSSDYQVWLFSLATRKPVSELPHSSPVTSVAFRDSSSLVSVSSGPTATAQIWQLPGPVITGFNDQVFSVSVDASGNKLAAAAGPLDNTVTLWNTASIQHPAELGPPITDPPGDSPYVGVAALTPSGNTAAVGSEDGTVQLWNITDPAHPVMDAPRFAAATALVESISVSGDGRLLAVGSDDGGAHLWNIADPHRPVMLGNASPRPLGLIYGSAFSDNANLMAAASSNGHGYLFSIRDPRHPRLLATLSGFAGAAFSVAFANHSHVLAIGSADGTTRLWDITHPSRPAFLTALHGPLSTVFSLAFNARTDELAAGSTDGTVWLWQLSAPRSPVYLATLTGPAKGILAVAFKPDGHTLVSGSQDDTVRLWNTSPAAAARWICATVGPPITRQQWAQFVTALPYKPPC